VTEPIRPDIWFDDQKILGIQAVDEIAFVMTILTNCP